VVRVLRGHQDCGSEMGITKREAMRWIRTHQGDKAHAVPHRSPTTLCGISLKDHAGAIVVLGPLVERCGNCDGEWCRRGRKKQPRRERDLTDYKPSYTIADWEEL